MDETLVREALAHINEVYETLPPYRRKDLIRLVLERVEVAGAELKLFWKAWPPDVEAINPGGHLKLPHLWPGQTPPPGG